MPVLLNSTEWKLGLFLTLLVKTFLQIIYPFEYINNALIPSIAAGKRNIFFLTDDAFGVPPTISRLSRSLGMCHFNRVIQLKSQVQKLMFLNPG